MKRTIITPAFNGTKHRLFASLGVLILLLGIGACKQSEETPAPETQAASNPTEKTSAPEAQAASGEAVGEMESFKVYGNCTMCQERIEGSLKGVEGVHSAHWNVETKVMRVDYDPDKIGLDAVHQKIAAVGHDTEKIKAKDSVYNNLMECCQYERSE